MIKFLLNGKEIASISIEGLMDGEITATKELLAYEKNVDIKDIKVAIEQQ